MKQLNFHLRCNKFVAFILLVEVCIAALLFSEILPILIRKILGFKNDARLKLEQVLLHFLCINDKYTFI